MASVMQYVSIDWLTDSNAGRLRSDVIRTLTLKWVKDNFPICTDRRQWVADGRWGIYHDDINHDLFVGCVDSGRNADNRIRERMENMDPCLNLFSGVPPKHQPLALPPNADVIVALLKTLDLVLDHRLKERSYLIYGNVTLPPPVTATDTLRERLHSVLSDSPPNDAARIARRMRLPYMHVSLVDGDGLSNEQRDATYHFALQQVKTADRRYSAQEYAARFV